MPTTKESRVATPEEQSGIPGTWPCPIESLVLPFYVVSISECTLEVQAKMAHRCLAFLIRTSLFNEQLSLLRTEKKLLASPTDAQLSTDSVRAKLQGHPGDWLASSSRRANVILPFPFSVIGWFVWRRMSPNFIERQSFGLLYSLTISSPRTQLIIITPE